MKLASLISIFCFSILSCTESYNTALVGKWTLTEQLIDIGDGNGSFQKSDLGYTIEFFRDGTVKSSVPLCTKKDAKPADTGTFSEQNGTIHPDGCKSDLIMFEFKDAELVLSFNCVEVCKNKYKKFKRDNI